MSLPEFGTLVEKEEPDISATVEMPEKKEKQEFPEFGTLVQEEAPRVEPSYAESAKEIGLETVKGLGRLTARGAASLLAAPSKGIGGLLTLISKTAEEGLPARQFYEMAGNYFTNLGESGQAHLKKQIEKTMGKSYGSGEEALTKFTERAADIYGRLPLKGMGAPSLLGAAGGQTAEELGASPEVQTLSELVGMSVKDIGKGIVSLTKKPFISESGLRLPKIVEKVGEKLKGVKAAVFPGRKEKVMEKLSTQAEELIAKIKKEEMPLAKEVEAGIDVSARNEANLNRVESFAKNLPNDIEANLISDYLDHAEASIHFGGVPTEEQEKIIKLIDKFKDKYEVSASGTRFFSPSQYVKQFRNINKDLKTLYQTKFVHGERLDTMKFYEGLKGSIEKTFEAGTPKSFSNLFKETNKEFSQIKKLEKFDEIIGTIATDKGTLDPKKFNTFITNNKKANMLRAQIGQKGFDKLRLISNDLYKAQKNLKMVSELGPAELVKSGITTGILSYLGIPFAKTYQVGKKGISLARGYMLTSEQGSRDVLNFLKAIKSGNNKAMTTHLLKMDENARKYEEKRASQTK